MLKRILSILCVLAILLSLAACQKEEPDSKKNETTAETQEQTTQTEPEETEATQPEETEPPIEEEPENQSPEEILPALSAIEAGDYETAYRYLYGLEDKSDEVKMLMSHFAFAPVTVKTEYETHTVIESYTYDSNGFMIKHEHGFGSGESGETTEWFYTHDEKGNILTEKYVSYNFDGTTSEWEYAYTYNSDGKPVMVVKTPGDYKATYTYDSNGNLLTKVEPGYISTYTYDESGNLIKIRNERSNGAWDETIREYDSNGNLISSAHQYSGASSASKETYTYDARGNRISKYEEDGAYWSLTEYTYDSNDNLIKSVSSNKNVSRFEEINYTYDENGNLLSITDISYPYAHHYTYDDLDNIVTMRCDATDEVHGHKLTTHTYQLFYYPDGVPEQIRDVIESYIPTDLYM